MVQKNIILLVKPFSMITIRLQIRKSGKAVLSLILIYFLGASRPPPTCTNPSACVGGGGVGVEVGNQSKENEHFK